MGLLFVRDFWAACINEMHSQSPVPGKPMSRESVQKILETGCKALARLTSDPDFERDLAIARDRAKKNPDDEKIQNFKDFIGIFRSVEREILMNSGTKEEAAVELVEELIGLAGELDSINQNLDQLSEKIRQVQRLACSGHASIQSEIEREALAKDVKRAVGGVAAISSDVTHLLIEPITGAIVAKISIPLGAGLIGKALARFWPPK